MQFKYKIVYLHEMGELKRYCSKFIISVFICLESTFLCQHGKKPMKTCIILFHMFLLLQEKS